MVSCSALTCFASSLSLVIPSKERVNKSFSLEHRWFTVLCWCQVCSKVIRLCIHKYPLFFRFISHCCCSVTKLCSIFWDPMECSTPGSSVLHCLGEFAQIHVPICSNSQWYYSTISSSAAPFSSCPQSFQVIRVFSNVSAFCIRWPKYWSFSISPSSEYLRLISCRIDWFDLLAVLSRVFSNTRIRKHQFVNAQASRWFRQ